MSKAVSEAAALSLVASDLLGLEDTIGERLPDVPESWHRVRLRELLSHTSGLPGYTQSARFAEAVTESPTSPPPGRELLEFVADQSLRFGPGSQYRYSNSDNIAVALMVESAAGASYRQALGRYVLEPLRLRSTSLPSVVDLPEPFIHGYEPGESRQPEDVSELIAATRDGATAVTFTINTQVADDVLPALRQAQELAVCAALGKDRAWVRRRSGAYHGLSGTGWAGRDVSAAR